MTRPDPLRPRLTHAYMNLGQRIWASVPIADLPGTIRGEHWPIRPETPATFPPPRQAGGSLISDLDQTRERLVAALPEAFPATGVTELRDIRVSGMHGWAVTADQVVVEDTSWNGSRFATQVRDPFLPPRSKRLGGTTLLLCTEYARSNYGHALYDLFPRVDLFERSGIGYDSVDQILCNLRERNRPLLEQLGVPLSKVVWMKSPITYRTERLLVTSFPGVPKIIAPWSAEFLRERLGVAPDGSGRRLYVPRRSHHRAIANEADLLPILTRHGFEEFDPGRSAGSSRAVFAAAELVVGGHGAGLADLIFSPPSASVMEIIPTAHAQPYFLAAAAAAGIDHRYVAAESLMTHHPNDPRGRQADATVDLDVFEAALEELVAERS